MPITTTNPVVVDHPDIPFDRLGVHLAISPTWGRADVGGSMSLRLVPYRQLPDGTVEKREDLARNMAVGDIFAEAQANPVFAQAFGQMWGALQGYITAAGL